MSKLEGEQSADEERFARLRRTEEADAGRTRRRARQLAGPVGQLRQGIGLDARVRLAGSAGLVGTITESVARAISEARQLVQASSGQNGCHLPPASWY